MPPRSQPATAQVEMGHIPAPIGGINRVAGALALPPADCLALVNMTPSQFGVQTRSGWREWITGITGTVDNRIRSTIDYHGSLRSGSADRLFVTTDNKIWAASSSTSSPSSVYSFTTVSTFSGHGVHAKVTVPGGHYLLYCDEVNGLHHYTEATSTWAAGGGEYSTSAADTGAGRTFTPSKMVGVCVFKNRVWFVERDSTRAWYLGTNAIFGEATSFDFGLVLRAGGTLVNLYNWSYDGGAGMDDALVIVSSAGDVLIYQGTDPASANTFGLKGVWSVGGVPAGRKVATDYGGEILITSKTGLVPLSRLVVGASTDDQSLYATRKIGPYFAQLANTYGAYFGWGTLLHPRDNTLMVLVPTEGMLGPTTQLAMSLDTKGWGYYRDLPITSATVWGGLAYFGTDDGRVAVQDCDVDDVDISDPTSFTPIDFSLLSGYTNLGNSRNKQIQSIRPVLVAGQRNVSMNVQARYDLDLSEPTAPSASGGGGSGSWDEGVWDTTLWGAEYTPGSQVYGAVGAGRSFAVAIRGKALSRVTLSGIDVTYIQGGVLG